MLSGLMRTHHCGELRKENVNQKVILCGWVNKYRNLGALHFIDLRDKFGLTQLSFEEFKGDFSVLKECSLESVILVEGEVRERPETARNKDMGTGEVELMVARLEILSKAEPVPFLPTGKVDATEDLRLKYRYLDFRGGRLQKMLSLRSETMQKIRARLVEEGFCEIETPILYKSTPEGARDYVVPSRIHKHKVYALPQSPQTLKQLLMIGGADKYFQLCRCFRDEDLRADRQPEFTQVDMEISFATSSYVKNVAETLIKAIFPVASDFTLPSLEYKDAIRLYGSDKPDTRFGLKHLIVTDLFKDSSFSTFSAVAQGKGMIKALFVPADLKTFSRKETDALTELIKPFGGKGVAFFKKEGEALSAGISKFITPEVLAELEKRLQANDEKPGEGTWFFVADSSEMIAHDCLDAVRRHFGKTLNLLGEGHSFLWVHSFPLLEYDEKEGRFYAKHHPFTSPLPEDREAFFSGDPEKLRYCRADAYDVVCNGYEIGGGSVRIFNNKVQECMFEVLGMHKEEIDSQFGFFVEALKYGTPPHAGMAFGLDRLIMLIAGTENIRDVIAFPKTTSAMDLMSEAPSSPSAAQIKELHFNWS